MKIQVIHNEEAHEAALRGLENLMDSDPPAGSEQYAELELLALVIHDYEAGIFPFPSRCGGGDPFPHGAAGIDEAGFGEIPGQPRACSEVLNGRRRLFRGHGAQAHRQLQIRRKFLLRNRNAVALLSGKVPKSLKPHGGSSIIAIPYSVSRTDTA